MIYPPIGVFLRTLRGQLGISKIKDMASKLGLSYYELASIEKGTKQPPEDFERKLCDAYDIHLHDYNEWMDACKKEFRTGNKTPHIPIKIAEENRGKTLAYYFVKDMCAKKDIAVSQLCSQLSIEASYLRFVLSGKAQVGTTAKWVDVISEVLELTEAEKAEFSALQHLSMETIEVSLTDAMGEDRANAIRIIDMLPTLSSSALTDVLSYIQKLN